MPEVSRVGVNIFLISEYEKDVGVSTSRLS